MQTATILNLGTGEVLRNSNAAIIDHRNARRTTCIRKQGALLDCDLVNFNLQIAICLQNWLPRSLKNKLYELGFL